MKIFYRLLFITLCVLIIYSTSCFCKTNGENSQGRTRISFPFYSNKSADEVINLAKKECDNFNYKKAISLYKQSLKLNPSNPDEVYYNIGNCYIHLDNYKKAVEPLSKSIELNPKTVPRISTEALCTIN